MTQNRTSGKLNKNNPKVLIFQRKLPWMSFPGEFSTRYLVIFLHGNLLSRFWIRGDWKFNSFEPENGLIKQQTIKFLFYLIHRKAGKNYLYLSRPHFRPFSKEPFRGISFDLKFLFQNFLIKDSLLQ